jgi:bacterioferritin
MKGNPKIIERLNALLADELTAISQYMVHSEMCDDWGFGKLHAMVEARALKEMEHAEELIGRIIFLEGRPTVSKLKAIHVGAEVEAQFINDKAAEVGAVEAYNEAIHLVAGLKDNGTKALLESIEKDEEDHLDEIETQLELISQVGLQNYLAQQIG